MTSHPVRALTALARLALIAALATTSACDAGTPEELVALATTDDALAHGNCAAAGSEGASCNDGLFCTVDDACHAGVCVGSERPCSSVVGFCDVATCNEATDTCVAAPREEACDNLCGTVKLQKVYRRGWQHGFEAVSKAWDRRHGNCTRTEAFVDRISTRLANAQRQLDPEATIKLQRRCRKSGVLDGAYAALGVVQSFCDETCFLDGDLVGKLSGETYCEMALGEGGPLDVAPWMRGPLDMCGLSYEVACDSSFIGTSVSYGSGPDSCEPLTEGVYAGAWDASRDRACDYRDQDAGVGH